MFVKKIYETILKRKLKKVNDYITKIDLEDADMQEMFDYAVGASGKRFRPLLIMLSCEAVGGNYKDIIPMAAAFEILHKASLVHDDLIDEDTHRRGVESFYTKFSKEKAVIMGDLMISIGLGELYKTRPVLGDRFDECFMAFLDTFRTLSMGELREEVFRDRTELTEEDIDKMHYEKTAVFLETAFRIGAVAGKGSDEEVKMLADFGRSAGQIFQILNDINNIDGFEAKVGKEVHADIKKTKKNHMIVHAMTNGTAEEKKILLDIMSQEELSKDDTNNILDILEHNKSIEHANKKIDTLIEEAKETIAPLRSSASKKLYLKLLEESRSKWYWESK